MLSVGRSVDQAMSAQYLFTPLLESCQTWYSGSPREKMTPIDILGHMVKGQGQNC